MDQDVWECVGMASAWFAGVGDATPTRADVPVVRMSCPPYMGLDVSSVQPAGHVDEAEYATRFEVENTSAAFVSKIVFKDNGDDK